MYQMKRFIIDMEQSPLSMVLLLSTGLCSVTYTANEYSIYHIFFIMIKNSIVHGGTSAFSHIIVPDTSTKSRAQKYERKITRAKSRAQKYERKNTSAILRAQNSKFYILTISWKLYAGKFLKTICWEILGNICWEILGNHMLENSGRCRLLFEGGNYGTMLMYHTTVSRQWHQGLS